MTLAKRGDALSKINSEVQKIRAAGVSGISDVSAASAAAAAASLPGIHATLSVAERRLKNARLLEEINADSRDLIQNLHRQRRVDEMRSEAGIMNYAKESAAAAAEAPVLYRGLGGLAAASTTGDGAESFSMQNLRTHRHDETPRNKCLCCKATLGTPKDPNKYPNQWQMYMMFEDQKYRLPVAELSKNISDLYMKNMHTHQVRNKELAIQAGKEFIEPEEWTPALVENHFRNHIIDNEFKVRLRLQDLELMREAIADQCFKVDAKGRIIYDDRSIKLHQMILKLSRDMAKGLN